MKAVVVITDSSRSFTTRSVPLAAGVPYPFFGLLLSPMVATAAMSPGSVSVIGNAPQLRKVAI